MKKLILGTLVLALVGAGLQTACAGDREWAVVGKVLTGVAVAGVVADTIDRHGGCVVAYNYGAPCPSPVVYAPPVVVCHRPVVFYHAPFFVHHVFWRARW
jgi:hypothetical protein